MTDNLVKRLRGWVRDIREGSTALWAMDQDLKAAADRIEELEAKLAKAVAALDELMPYVGDGWAAQIARTTLAELKGEGDGLYPG